MNGKAEIRNPKSEIDVISAFRFAAFQLSALPYFSFQLSALPYFSFQLSAFPYFSFASMIRILGGRFKGRQVVGVLRDPGVRPITARMRQSLFDILRPWLPGSRFLDLFAGSGAVGLEALSRGAVRAVFVERDPRCVKGIQRNLAHFGLGAAAEVHRLDIPQTLGRLQGSSFDLIFAGPPYKDDQKRPLRLAGPALEAVLRARLLAPGGTLVVQHHKSDAPPTPPGMALWREQRYGDTRIGFYRRREDVTSVTGEPGGGSERIPWGNAA